MGLGVSKCCKERPSDDAARAERTPLNDAERGSAGAGTSGRATSDRQDPPPRPSARGRRWTRIPTSSTPSRSPDRRLASSAVASLAATAGFAAARATPRARRAAAPPTRPAAPPSTTSGPTPGWAKRASSPTRNTPTRLPPRPSSEEEFDADGQPHPEELDRRLPCQAPTPRVVVVHHLRPVFHRRDGRLPRAQPRVRAQTRRSRLARAESQPRRPFDDADTLRSEITTAAAATGASGATRVHFSNLADGPERFVVDAIPEGASDASDASAFEAFDASAYDASDASLHADPANGRGRGETRGRARRESRSISEDVEDTSRILDAESRADLKDAATRNLRRRIEDEVREAEDEVREAEDEVREARATRARAGRGKGKRETEKLSRRRKSTRVAAGAEEDGDARRADSGADSGADSVPPSNRARGTRGNRRTS